MAENFESNWSFWARRYIWALVKVGGTSRATELRRQFGLLSYNFNELVLHFSELKAPKLLKEGQIVAILGSYGIDRKWEGPCKGKEIKAGRAYQRVVSEVRGRSTTSQTGKTTNSGLLPNEQDELAISMPKRRARSFG